MDKIGISFNLTYILRLLSCSLMLNLFLISRQLMHGGLGHGWSRRAAEEAEGVASVPCSGHGRVYLDGLLLPDGKPACECNACFGGPDCSQFLPVGCIVDADSGNPIFLEPFWMQHAASSAIVVAGWHRMGYEYDDGSLSSKELERQILELHATVGNAITEGRYIVFGAGSTQLLNAAVHALSVDLPHTSSSPRAKVVASSPYYPVYKSQTELFESKKYEFNGDAFSWKEKLDSSVNYIEFVTSPNNPDGQLKKAILEGPSVKTIHDLAYYWPHYTPIPGPVDEDLMLFTLSKLTGHAGSRFGWAIVKDRAVYERMLTYMDLNTYGVARETQLRALKLLKVVLEEGKGRKLFDFGYKTMRHRWEKLSEALSKSKRFSIQEIPPLFCTYSKHVRGPSPAFAWVKCERQEEDKDCFAVLRTANISGRAGSSFGAETSYVRLSLVKTQDDFDLLLQRIGMLVMKEKVDNSHIMDPFMLEENKFQEKNSSLHLYSWVDVYLGSTEM